MPYLISLFGDDPPNSGIDLTEASAPHFFVHLRDEPSHGDTSPPNYDVNDPCIRHDQARVVQLSRDLEKWRHPEALVVDCFGIKKVSVELLVDRFTAGVGNRIRQHEWGKHQQRKWTTSFHLVPDEVHKQCGKK